MKGKFLILVCSLFIRGVLAQGIDANLEESKKYQDNLNKEYADSITSPLEKEDLKRFKSLHFYPLNTKFYVMANFKRSRGEKKFKMKTSTDRLPEYIKYGEVTFSIDGSTFKLSVYRNIELSKRKEFKKYLFLPFTDLTTGETSYGGGRYIDLEIPDGKEIIIDFNKAYNPYCAYTHSYSCPIPPPENFLNIKVEAGVMDGLKYKD